MRLYDEFAPMGKSAPRGKLMHINRVLQSEIPADFFLMQKKKKKKLMNKIKIRWYFPL